MAERMESPLRREQIAEAALTIVVEQGLGAVTVRRVAEAVGISAAALYRHYKNKGDILTAVLEEHHEMALANLRQAAAQGTTPLEVLELIYRGMMKMVIKYRALPVIFLSDVLWFEETRLSELKLRHHKLVRGRFLEIFKQGQAQKQIRSDIRPEELFVHFLGLIAMPALICVRDVQDVDMPRQITANWELFIHAVRV
ncbi:TetR/AcrR family transcriptional regulator [Solidesulfovibrio sp. C21]|uniref:TetR/AcrR family transcriptional regulator n=1 Tax=Solidesulfovibrio sp. C21 TaxID=3398613 RepID=UPI0039FDBBCD